jgi:competence ComEA-like helix-hairpin-helix protein
MFYLTPQERRVLFGFVCVCMLGATIHAALMFNARPLRWIKTSSQKIKRLPPDINRDDAKRLDRIDGIGPKTAANIVAFREKHGSFKKLDDLRKVKGITLKNYQKIKAFYLEALQHDR